MKKRQSIRKIFCFTVLAGLIPSCATLHSPHNWLPKVNDVPSEAYGGWLTVDYTVQGQKYGQFRRAHRGDAGKAAHLE